MYLTKDLMPKYINMYYVIQYNAIVIQYNAIVTKQFKKKWAKELNRYLIKEDI